MSRIQHENESEAPGRLRLQIDHARIMDFAAWHYVNHDASQRWNGRQIRNAFQIAYSLADFDMQKDHFDQEGDEVPDVTKNSSGGDDNSTQKPPAVLNHKQFELVAMAVEKFDDYLYDAIAGTETDYARMHGLRADDHEPNMYASASSNTYPMRAQHVPTPPHTQSYWSQTRTSSTIPSFEQEYSNQSWSQVSQYTAPQHYSSPGQNFQPSSQQRSSRHQAVPRREKTVPTSRMRARFGPSTSQGNNPPGGYLGQREAPASSFDEPEAFDDEYQGYSNVHDEEYDDGSSRY